MFQNATASVNITNVDYSCQFLLNRNFLRSINEYTVSLEHNFK